jgi:PAS domain S-box-containing protein
MLAATVKRAKVKRRPPTKSKSRVRDLEKRYDLVMSAINESVYDWDIAHDRFVTSGSMQRLLGVPRERLTLAGWQKSIHPEDFPRFRDGTIAHLKGLTERFECDYRFLAQDGSWHWARTHGLATRDRKGRAIRMVGSTGDITELKSTEERQTAITEILAAMSASPTDTGPVFEAIVQSALRLFPDAAVYIRIPQGEEVRLVAIAHRDPRQVARLKKQAPVPLSREYLHGAAILDRRVVDVADVAMHDEASLSAGLRNFRASGYRAVTIMPMLRGETAIGTIAIARQKAGPLAERQVALLRTFADEAVIAIENVRNFNDTREALAQQTATAEILTVMSNSTTNVQPVFDAIVRNVQRLFGTRFAVLQLVRGGQLELVAFDGQPGFKKITAEFPRPLSGDSIGAKSVRSRGTAQIAPIIGNPAAPERSQRMAHALGYNSLIATPMVRGDGVIGAIVTGHHDGRPFSGRQAELLKAFADQAVIAIENVRLFNETKEALEHQKASGEVLEAISGSIADTQPVFDKILDSCERLFAGRIVGLNVIRDDGMLHIGAYHGAHRDAFEQIFPIPVARESGSGLAITERRVVHYPDTENGTDVPERTRVGCKAIGIKSVIFAPVLWEGRGLGSIFVGRDHVSSFSEKEIALLRTFADQAAIAIENVRLFHETKEALERQTVTSSILSVMAGSPGDVAPVFESIVRSGVRLFPNAGVTVAIPENGQVRLMAIAERDPERARKWTERFPFPLTREYMHGVALLDCRMVDMPDVERHEGFAAGKRNFAASGYRAMTVVPMVKDGAAIGSIAVVRDAPGPLSEKQIAVLKTFADQAVIAIENVRLFNEIQDKSRQLEIASRHKSEFLANMSHELRTPLNAIIGFTRLVMRRSKGALEAKQYENLEKILASGQQLLALINAILDLSKIEAGRIEVVAAETPLAPVLEQCLRTVEPLVKVPLVKAFDGGLPAILVDEAKLRQVVINLLSNAAKFTDQGSIQVRAQASNGSVAIAVADTGIGIPEDKLGLIFEEFEQVDASSTRTHAGTGLGLAIARRLARLMGGDIGVESALGKGSTFTLTLPLRYPA